ncbi:MAG: branched-chain amino acid transaminase [Deltaproteobacteria bacterium]|nr:branched-chain amino acid transaminase [Deltaproteobacteria bacterium]
MTQKAGSFIWLDGTFVPWDDAKVHLLTHTLHYGLGAFEGIRCYRRADGRSAVFRLVEHVDRLLRSAHICTIDVPYSREQLAAACLETLRQNAMAEGYLRPLVFLGDPLMGLGTLENPTRVAIAAFVWGAYLGDEGLRTGIRARVSSFTRTGVNSAMSKGKICGQYVNSILAKREAHATGHDEAIMLDQHGHVAEATGENLFVVTGGQLLTAPLSSPILGGITRDSVLRLARDAGLAVREEVFTRDQLYVADEVFLTGTAAELTPVREIDGRRVGRGEVGPLTRQLQEAYFDVVKGATPRYPEWVTYV